MTTATATPRMDAPLLQFDDAGHPLHTRSFRERRILNWFPLGVTYAVLYMGRYNLTVAKTALGSRMTNEDFGWIFFAGTLVYAVAFLFNGPMTDRLGGRRAMLTAAAGSAVMNVLLGALTWRMFTGEPMNERLAFWLMCTVYGLNMYFQSFAAVAVIKVNAQWFHVRERGSFSGIFGTMISSGIFLAYSINGAILDVVSADRPAGSTPPVWWVFFIPGGIIALMYVIETLLLRDRPSDAGHSDFDTGDSAATSEGDVHVVGSSRVDLQACKLEYSIVSPK